MKLFISADIEGTTGITHWDEAMNKNAEYQEFRKQMTEEVVSACEGAINAGVSEILIKDAHHTGRNIIASRLPDCARLIRGWSGHPFCMVQELDQSFNACILIGYHSKAGTENNPLAHTLVLGIDSLKINGELASEFLLHTYVSAFVNVPVVLVSGDKGICQDVKAINEHINTVPVSEGIGASTLSISPELACKRIRSGVEEALKKDVSMCRIELPEFFEVEIKFRDPVSAYKASFYPGMKKGGPKSVVFETADYFEVMRMIMFII
ncbi:MAG: M55 family metallopeptidase [SAR324 cluster bacterium]|nr:M55 family metallopeptidase [SAR324 cluster bacterium]